MSNAVVRTIVENIVNDKFESLKEDVSKAVSAKAVNVLESKKAMIGKKFFDGKGKQA
jgi:glycine cleavage system regulatory protein